MDSQGNAYTAYGSYNTASSYTVGTWMFVATASATVPLTVTMTNLSGISSSGAGALEYENLTLLNSHDRLAVSGAESHGVDRAHCLILQRPHRLEARQPELFSSWTACPLLVLHKL